MQYLERLDTNAAFFYLMSAAVVYSLLKNSSINFGSLRKWLVSVLDAKLDGNNQAPSPTPDTVPVTEDRLTKLESRVTRVELAIAGLILPPAPAPAPMPVVTPPPATKTE